MQDSKYFQTLYLIITVIFCVLVVVSNVISGKLINMPFSGGINITAGLLTYPATFLISDLVTEIYGAAKAKLMIYIAFGMSLMSYAIIQAVLLLPGANGANHVAFQATLGLNGLIVFASLTAFALAQIADVHLYARIKRWTGDRFLWLRNNGSILISQVVDTIAVNMIYFYWGLGMEWAVVWQIMMFSYAYKAAFSVINTPIFYFLVYWMRKPIHRVFFVPVPELENASEKG